MTHHIRRTQFHLSQGPEEIPADAILIPNQSQRTPWWASSKPRLGLRLCFQASFDVGSTIQNAHCFKIDDGAQAGAGAQTGIWKRPLASNMRFIFGGGEK